ncbi:hypothetical protein RU639_005968 [Aspergillus parasiticus]
MLNYAGSLVNTTAPSFPSVAVVRAAYNLMRTGATQKAQDNIQHLVKYFFKFITSSEIWDKPSDMGLLSIPVAEDYELLDFVTHIVPKGKSRVRVMIHAENTEKEVDYLVATLCDFVNEMIDIEEGSEKGKIPKAVQEVYALMAANA